MADQEIGIGRLSWSRYERIGDRYGTVKLFDENEDELALDLGAFAGFEGSLVCQVLETRESGHIGDLFRGLHPVTPEVGESIALGAGTLFRSRENGTGCGGIGVRPGDHRDSDWLDPRALYRCHDQTVRLLFQPASP